MKFLVSKKEMKESYSFIIGIGYCDAQHLLYYEIPIAYSAGTYGWACDYYEIGNVLISTGYNHLQNKNTNASYELINEYNKKAEAIVSSDQDYKTKKEQVKALLTEFVKIAKENFNKK